MDIPLSQLLNPLIWKILPWAIHRNVKEHCSIQCSDQNRQDWYIFCIYSIVFIQHWNSIYNYWSS
jgi:hypothetical protein